MRRQVQLGSLRHLIVTLLEGLLIRQGAIMTTISRPHYGVDAQYGIAIHLAMQSVLETSIFTRRADALLTREERLN